MPPNNLLDTSKNLVDLIFSSKREVKNLEEYSRPGARADLVGIFLKNVLGITKSGVFVMTNQELHDHLQAMYFDNVDTADPAAAVLAFTPDVYWQHTQVWAHDGHDSRHTDRLQGRDSLYNFLQARVAEMQVIQIKHRVDEAIICGERGAFRASVLGPTGKRLGFLGWVELRDDLIQRYIVVPEDFAASPHDE